MVFYMKFIKKLLFTIILLVIIFSLAILGIGKLYYNQALKEKPLITRIDEITGKENFVKFEDMSADYRNAVISVEDHRFYDHGPVDFIANIIETLSLQNVTKDSVTVGLCASGIMGVKMEALENAQAQQKRVIGTLKCKPFISDRRKLERYVNKRWCNKITMLMNAA